jgi:rRNA-processing protein FCF1/L-amino acid N-acyltransferase YncA
MRVLIDTNILIHLEDNKVLSDEFALFYNQAIKNKCEVFYHKACIEDLNRDKDKARKEVVLSKLKKYQVLENPAILSSDFSKELGEKKVNDRIDNEQLLQLHKGYIELLVTNDKGIKKKAKKLNIEHKVLNSEEALAFLDSQFTLTIPSHPVIDHVSVRALENDFDAPFFTSLKNDYDPVKFMEWISRCSKEDRKCYILRIESELSAILIYNVESAKDHNLKGINDDAIKICTFKVGDGALGLKLGELFLNKMFAYCMNKNVNYLYVTTYEKQKGLIYILSKFGFEKHEEFNNSVGSKETVFIKKLLKQDQVGKTGNDIHPFFREEVNKYIVPIQSEYYQTLFKDRNLRNPTLFDDVDYGLQEMQGNTIIKAYISKSPRQDLNPNDLLFFYSSKKYKSIEPLGVLIEHKRVDNFDELWEMVKSKTVYSQSILKEKMRTSKYLTVTIFRLVTYLNPPVKFDFIKTLECFDTKFQTFTKIGDTDYSRIKKNHIDESFIVD